MVLWWLSNSHIEGCCIGVEVFPGPVFIRAILTALPHKMRKSHSRVHHKDLPRPKTTLFVPSYNVDVLSYLVKEVGWTRIDCLGLRALSLSVQMPTCLALRRDCLQGSFISLAQDYSIHTNGTEFVFSLLDFSVLDICAITRSWLRVNNKRETGGRFCLRGSSCSQQ